MPGDSADDLELLDRAVAGDRDAFDRLFARQTGWLSARAAHLLDGKAGAVSCDASDLVQETAARTWGAWSQFRLPPRPEERLAKFRQFLIRVAENYFKDLIKSAHARYLRLESMLFESPDDGLDQTQPAAVRTPGRAAGDAEAAAQIKSCFDALPEDYRVIVRMHYWDGLSYAEIASLTGKTPDAVKGVLGRARQRMCECMVRSSLWFTPRRD